ncbi:MAG TPA: ABC transporter substrate-binding protein [Stellaceae bacterium]|nr:ABC transporter substrate-binding protein [Stellaceae bacterium]
MKKSTVLGIAAAILFGGVSAHAEIPGNVVKIGVLNDATGPFADLSGPASVEAARLAVEDFTALGSQAFKVEIVYADHQNKADVGAAITRKWVDQDGVDAVVDVPNTAVAFAVNDILRDKNRVFLASSVASSDLTGPKCAATTVQWTFDTWALAHGTGSAVTRQGGDSWFFIAADYAFGQALERDTSAVVLASGGKVLGSVRHPLNTADFASYLLQAQASKAKVVGLADAGSDAVTALKQASEFGLMAGGQRVAGLLVFLTDIHSLGLPAAQGLLLTEAFYWDLNAETRAWSARFAARTGGRMPTMNHAGVYSSVLAYLKAVAASKTIEGGKVVDEMKRLPINDPLFGGTVTIRADGRAVHPMYLFQVKTPAESKAPWDYYTLVATIPAQEAFRPLAEGGCGLVK